jgi:hypothetical protein
MRNVHLFVKLSKINCDKIMFDEKEIMLSPSTTNPSFFQAKVIPVAEVMTKLIDEEIIALHTNSGHCYKFDPIASAIWKLIEQEFTIADMLNELTDCYDVSRPEIQKDLLETLSFLENEQLVKIFR